MKLRYQLLIISLLLLLLPWGAWQYLKAVDVALRESQSQSLLENARLIADRLTLEASLFNTPFTLSGNSYFPASGVAPVAPISFYAYPFNNLPVLDGYGEEWRNSYAEIYSLQSNVQEKADTLMQLQIGAYHQKIYFYLNAVDSYLQYYNPSADEMAADYLLLSSFNADGERLRDYLIRPSAPSEFIAHYYDEAGVLRLQSGIKGVWRETLQGYQLELSVEKRLLQHGFELTVMDKQEQNTQLFKLAEVKTHLSTLSKTMQQFIEEFRSSSFTVKVLNAQQWLVAVEHSDKVLLDRKTMPWIIEWFYRKLLESEKLLLRNKNPYLNYQEYPEIVQSQLNGQSLQWYRRDGYQFQSHTLASVAIPIYYQQNNSLFTNKNQHLLGYLVLEKTTDQLIALTASAFGQLFTYTMGAFFIVALVLLLYASWLSMRISRLHRVANQAIDDSGIIDITEQSWPDLKRSDELGDLSRTYRNLLAQLQQYNDYLRTLSSKLSHELRTPIAVVKSSLENMSQVDAPAMQEEYQQRAQQGIQRLNSILTSMSSANSIEQSIGDAEFEIVDLNDFLQVITSAYQDAYSEHNIVFISQTENAHVLMAAELFVQMMDKLIDNATDFAIPSSEIVIRLKRYVDRVIIAVENIGPPLPDSMRHNLFDSMITLRNKGDSEEAHLGLGLYIVRLIAECHGGYVEADNLSDEKGVVFSISLPCEE